MEQGKPTIGAKLIEIKKDIADHMRTGSPSRIEIIKKHDIADHTFRKYLKQIEAGSASSTTPEGDAPELSETGMTTEDLVICCGYAMKRAMIFLSQANITARDVEVCQRIFQSAKECIYGKENPILAIQLAERTTEELSAAEPSETDIAVSKEANPASLKTLAQLYGLASKHLQ